MAEKRSRTAKRGEPGYYERNMNGIKNPELQNATFPDVSELEQVLNAYFDDRDASGRLYGEGDLLVWLSQHNRFGRTVATSTWDAWYEGTACPWLQDAVRLACLRIQAQLETDPAYREKGMVTASIFQQKQKRLGGKQDRLETKTDNIVRVIYGSSMDESDFK